MIKLFVALVVTGLLVMFAVQNMKPVTLYLLFQGPVNINLVLLVFVSFVLGVAAMYFRTIVRDIRKQKTKKRAVSGMSK